jgi:hypothetical protein
MTEWFVSTSGSSSGSGTITDPWDIVTAFAHPVVVEPGDTIWVRGGTYVGLFTSSLAGSAGNLITVRNYNGERAILDANVTTSLAEAANDSQTTLELSSAANLTTSMFLLLESDPAENVDITSISGNQVTVIRGRNGTTARSHSALVTVRPVGEKGLNVDGSYVRFQGLEFTSSYTTRVSATSGSAPYDEPNGGVNHLTTTGIQFINCLLHNSASGFGVWAGSAESVLYGNLIWCIGWDGPDRLHGHGTYTQNNTASRLWSNNIFFSTFGKLVNQYGSDTSFLNNYTWNENIFFHGVPLHGGESDIDTLTLTGNKYWNTSPQLGFLGLGNVNLTLTDNYIPYPTTLKYWNNVTATGNTFVNRTYNWAIYHYYLNADEPDEYATYAFDENQFHSPAGAPNQRIVYSRNDDSLVTADYNFSEWQALGQDTNGTLTTSGDYLSPMPLPDTAFVFPNAYDSNLAHVVIYNWSLSDTVILLHSDLSSVLASGDRYILRNVQDYFVDIVTGTYDGVSLSVDMTGHTVDEPLGYVEDDMYHSMADVLTTTFPEFGVFVLERAAAEYTTLLIPGVELVHGSGATLLVPGVGLVEFVGEASDLPVSVGDITITAMAIGDIAVTAIAIGDITIWPIGVLLVDYYILLESGDYLITEAGDKLVIE